MWHTVLLCMVLMLGLHSALAASWEDCDQGEDVDRAIQACTETQSIVGLDANTTPARPKSRGCLDNARIEHECLMSRPSQFHDSRSRLS